jgi:hypothetical protein
MVRTVWIRAVPPATVVAVDVVLAIAIQAGVTLASASRARGPAAAGPAAVAVKNAIRVVAVHADVIRVGADRANAIPADAIPALEMLALMVRMTRARMTIHVVVVGGSLAVAITIRLAERVIMATAVCTILLVTILAARKSVVKTQILCFPVGSTRGLWGMAGTRRIILMGR